MNPQDRVIDLLRWMQEANLSTDRRSARAICPITKKIVRVKDLDPNRQRDVLPLPTVRDLNKKGLRIRRREMGALTVLQLTGLKATGAGVGEEIAVLSLMNQARKQILVA